MVEAPEKIWAKTHGASTDVISGKRGLIGGWNEHQRDGQIEYVRSDIAERQIAELRAEVDTQRESKEFAQRCCEAAEAENARLRALPLKDEVERVLEPFVRAILPDAETLSGWKFGTKPKHEHYVAARAILSRLRAGEQEGWREIEEVPDNKLGPFLVTNNPKALNAFNRPSHVWCVGSIHADDDGGFCAFDGYQKIHGLKLYMPVSLPAAPKQGEAK